MLKKDLKNGMILEDREKNRFMVVNNFLMGIHEWNDLENYNEDLTNKRFMTLDIVKVYEVPDYGGFENIIENIENYNKVIWEEKQVNWSQVKVDTKLRIKRIGFNVRKAHFAGYDSLADTIKVWKDGKTSFTTNAIDEFYLSDSETFVKITK